MGNVWYYIENRVFCIFLLGVVVVSCEKWRDCWGWCVVYCFSCDCYYKCEWNGWILNCSFKCGNIWFLYGVWILVCSDSEIVGLYVNEVLW